MIQDVLGLVIILAWLMLAIVVVGQLIRAARKSGRIFAGLRTLLSYRYLLYLLSVFGLSLIKASLVFVYPQEAGVVVSIVSPKGVRPHPLLGGLHWVVPFAERVTIYPLYWQTYEMSHQPTSYDSADTVRARTKDGQEIVLDCTIIFRLDPDSLVPLHVRWQRRYLQDLVHPVLRGVLREQVARYTVEELNSSNRAALIGHVDQSLRSIGEKNGLIVKAFLPRNLAFVSGYAASVEQKQIAAVRRKAREYEAIRIETLAQGQAQRIKLTAAASAQAVVVKASAQRQATIIRKRAEAQALTLVKTALTNPRILTYRYIEQLSTQTAVSIVKGSKISILLPGAMGMPFDDVKASPF